MTTIVPERPKLSANPANWSKWRDPITRIVGSLGIYTKIDFDNKEVVECHSTPRRSSAATRSS